MSILSAIKDNELGIVRSYRSPCFPSLDKMLDSATTNEMVILLTEKYNIQLVNDSLVMVFFSTHRVIVTFRLVESKCLSSIDILYMLNTASSMDEGLLSKLGKTGSLNDYVDYLSETYKIIRGKYPTLEDMSLVNPILQRLDEKNRATPTKGQRAIKKKV